MKLTVNGNPMEWDSPRTLNEIAKEVQKSALAFVAAYENGVLKELTSTPADGADVKLVTIEDEQGKRIYIRTLTYLFIYAVLELFPKAKVEIHHAIGSGLYCEVRQAGQMTAADYAMIEMRMQEVASKDLPFIRTVVTREQAIEFFESVGQTSQARLLRYRDIPHFSLYQCGWMKDYFYGYMAPSTGCMTHFSLQYSWPGVILKYPMVQNGQITWDNAPHIRMTAVFREGERWGDILECSNTADLNDLIKSGGIDEFIRVNEALHEKKLSQLTEMICSNKEKRVILISGPSSSGKTTFANRLRTHLKANGEKPVMLSLDNYYKNKEDIGLDEYGDKDLENIASLDTELFNEQVLRMLEGEEVETPLHSFITGKREPKGNVLRLLPGAQVVVEGIHGLNPKMSEAIDEARKFRIYISPMTSLNLDDHNMIPADDIRLLRRIVRDSRFRNHGADKTIAMWKSVNRGEEKFIFPYQENADVMFNSALVYEIAALKKYAYPMLKELQDGFIGLEATRLRKFLNYFLSVENESEIPPSSIIREFVGGSCFYK
ncbi:MAG: uridine kinase family protein [Christensenellales bacterium]